jgi:PadR family transcriptional regulator, regulatory protein PadR
LLTSDNSRHIVDTRHKQRWILEGPVSRDSTHDVLRGTLDLLILQTLSRESLHGWAITQRIQQLSEEALQVGQGSLYPALQRLEQRGWVDSEWLVTEQNRRAKYYRLTRSGRKALGDELTEWRRYVRAVDLVLEGS